MARGHREVVVTGVNVGRYRCDGLTLADVIRLLEAIPGLDRIRISSIEPTTISDELLERMAGSSKLCRYLHVPLQSGDDGILHAMNRRYTAREYARFIEKAFRTVPDLGLGTDLGGSIRIPAAFCGISGIRPVPGRVPVYPTDFGWDTLVAHVHGPMARSVADLGLMLAVLAGPDDRDPSSLPAPTHDYATAAGGRRSGPRRDGLAVSRRRLPLADPPSGWVA